MALDAQTYSIKDILVCLHTDDTILPREAEYDAF